MKPSRMPRGLYPGETPILATRQARSTRYKATGDFRPPHKGEFFLSGAEVQAHRALADLNFPYWIAVAVTLVECPHCNGTGKVEAIEKP
jgi:hypothetical protein